MRNLFLSVLLGIGIMADAQTNEHHDSYRITIDNGQYTLYKNGIIERVDSLLFNPDYFFPHFPKRYELNYTDTADFILFSDLYKELHQPILYNKNLNYLSVLDPWTTCKGDPIFGYMVTAIINDSGTISLRYVNSGDSSVNNFVLSKIRSKPLIHKIMKMANLSILPYDGANFVVPVPPIIIEYKINGEYNVLPFMSAPELYIKPYKLTRKLHRIAERKVKKIIGNQPNSK